MIECIMYTFVRFAYHDFLGSEKYFWDLIIEFMPKQLTTDYDYFKEGRIYKTLRGNKYYNRMDNKLYTTLVNNIQIETNRENDTVLPDRYLDQMDKSIYCIGSKIQMRDCIFIIDTPTNTNNS